MSATDVLRWSLEACISRACLTKLDFRAWLSGMTLQCDEAKANEMASIFAMCSCSADWLFPKLDCAITHPSVCTSAKCVLRDSLKTTVELIRQARLSPPTTHSSL